MTWRPGNGSLTAVVDGCVTVLIGLTSIRLPGYRRARAGPPGAPTGRTAVITEVDFALGGDIEDLHATLRNLRALGPVAAVRYYEEPAWLLTTYDAVEAAYRDDDLFPAAAAFKELTEPVLGRNLQCMHGEEHRRNRMLVSPAFRARAMPEVVRPLVEDVAHELVDRFASRGEAELVDEFDRMLPGVVITRMLGVPRDADAD